MTSDMAIPGSRDPNGPICPLAQGCLGAAPANCPRTAFDPVVIDGSKALAAQRVNSPNHQGSGENRPQGALPVLGNTGELPQEGLGKVLLVREVPAPPLCHECRRERY
jgi:hypothetical protein